MSLVDALEADRAGEIELAAAHYEKVLLAGDASLVALVNLALLYWQATDPGLAATKKLRPSFLAIAGRRIPELLDEAQRRFPHSTEVRFWKRYIAWADLGEKLDSAYCRQLLQEDPTTPAPALYLFSTSDGDEAVTEAHELLGACHRSGTTGARYTASVIESTLRSKKWRLSKRKPKE